MAEDGGGERTMRKVLGGAWPLVAAGAVAAVVWATGEPAGRKAASGLPLRQAEYHIAHCSACRAAGVRPEEMASEESPTPCHADKYPSKEARAILEDMR